MDDGAFVSGRDDLYGHKLHGGEPCSPEELQAHGPAAALGRIMSPSVSVEGYVLACVYFLATT